MKLGKSVKFAQTGWARFDDGTEVRVGNEIDLPTIVGGGTGVLQNVRMVVDLPTEAVSFQFYIKMPQGHVSIFTVPAL